MLERREEVLISGMWREVIRVIKHGSNTLEHLQNLSQQYLDHDHQSLIMSHSRIIALIRHCLIFFSYSWPGSVVSDSPLSFHLISGFRWSVSQFLLLNLLEAILHFTRSFWHMPGRGSTFAGNWNLLNSSILQLIRFSIALQASAFHFSSSNWGIFFPQNIFYTRLQNYFSKT